MTAVEQATMNAHGSSSSTHAISWDLDIPCATVWRILHNVSKFYPYKISHMHQLLFGDKKKA